MKAPQRLGLVAASVLLGSLSSQAQSVKSPASVETLPPLFEVSVRPGEVVGNEQVIRVFFKSGTNEFFFVQPPDLRTEVTDPGSLTLTSVDRTYYLKLRINNAREFDSEASQAQARREGVLAQHSGAEGVEDFTMAVAGRSAQGLQLTYKSPTQVNCSTRIVWVPSKAGILEFALTSETKTAKQARVAMDFVLLTLQTNENGRLAIVRHQEQS